MEFFPGRAPTLSHSDAYARVPSPYTDAHEPLHPNRPLKPSWWDQKRHHYRAEAKAKADDTLFFHQLENPDEIIPPHLVPPEIAKKVARAPRSEQRKIVMEFNAAVSAGHPDEGVVTVTAANRRPKNNYNIIW